jgi:hypothetical protein
MEKYINLYEVYLGENCNHFVELAKKMNMKGQI